MLHADRILQRFGLVLTVATVWASVGCGAQPKAAVDNASDLNQLTDQLISCVEYNKAQSAQKLVGMPDGFIADDTLPSYSEKRKAADKLYAGFSWTETLTVTSIYIVVLLGISCWWFATKDY